MLSNFKWCCMWRYDKMLGVISEEGFMENGRQTKKARKCLKNKEKPR